ncbi:AsnC family transcriptional regulator [Actinoplanes sp. SE50]|uniref:Lrp/AsnC family transcriptional regulator n=1 Tax=unclassified Actinoplanes TaxID=2626549 RepID=UPI00023EBD22|nr:MULTISPECIES: Lrp/AsnC family transcriptional regulator [unclassified Actinoplanes]AEV83999.1 Leucine-responsive regulatory protein [Actinoplanes sp. SE50/110]ATO82392.1 AsnC family transcriptional regulator [Actinoplanes sp. SE50]SLL99799.1 AsnC-family transcriptional regulator [Actinoplanes sp. SE50/110]
MDSIDRRILLELQKDGRLTNQELADRVGLSPSPCLRRVRQLQDSGVISGYTAVLSAEALGLTITAFARLTLLSHTSTVVDEVEARLRAIPEVVEAYLLAGDDDYMVKIVVASFAAYEDLLRRELRAIPSLGSITTSFAFAVTKPQSPLPMP